MTIQEAINRCDAIKPNQYDDSEKISWLSDLDGIVKSNVYNTHVGSEEIPFEPYIETSDTDTVLLIPEPHTDVYLHYMFAKIDFNQAEYKRYNNSMMMFNTAYEEFTKHYNRTHMPLQNNSITL